MDIVIKVLLFFLVVQKVYCQTLTCNCSNGTKCLAQNVICILNIIVYKDFSLEQGLFWPRDLIMYKYKIFSVLFHDTGIA